MGDSDKEEALHDILENHARLVMNVVHEFVTNIDNLDSLNDKLLMLGKFHVKNEVPERFLDIMGPIFCNAVRPILLQNDVWSQDVEDSWMELFRILTSKMRKAYDGDRRPEQSLSLCPTQEIISQCTCPSLS